MEINLPAIVAEVEAAFAAYERAFVSNDIQALNDFFVKSESTVRYGVAEQQYGLEAIKAYRARQPSTGLERELLDTIITTYGRDAAVASTLFFRDSAKGKVGRQMQTWIRVADGWRVAAAHVSLIDEPGI
ncbi:MAG: oxalurate catabolism protein HpxZ [Devosia sp.]